MKRAILSEASISSTPARCSGWLAMIAATRPFRRMNPTTAFGAKSACTSRNEWPSAMRVIASRTSYASSAASGIRLSSSATSGSMLCSASTIGGSSALLDGR